MARLAWLSAFALAMALVEAAVVVHLRHLYYPADPQALFPLVPLTSADLGLEMARELATVVMIGAVAVFAERGWARRFAAFVFVFGLWDLGYYAWLKIFLDWPRQWLEWDVLFLLPWPWFGPWLAPALVALVFALWGGVVLAGRLEPRWTRGSALLFTGGTALALFTFLAPAWPLLPGGEAAFRGHVPESFAWPLFLAGLAGMAAGLVHAWRRGGAK
jgi:hypothetical protein